MFRFPLEPDLGFNHIGGWWHTTHIIPKLYGLYSEVGYWVVHIISI